MIEDINVTTKGCKAELLSPWHSKTVRCRLSGCTNRHKWWNFKGEQILWTTDDQGRPTAWGLVEDNAMVEFESTAD